EVDSGLRGYLITGHPYFLDPYSKTAPAIRASIDTLAGMVKDGDPIQSRRIDELRSVFDRWERFSQEILALRQQDGDYNDYKINLRGEVMMDEMRVVLTLFITLESELRDRRGTLASLAARNTTVWVVGLALGMGCLLALFARRQLLGLSRTYANALVAVQQHADALRENEEQFRQMALNASDLLYVRYPDGLMSWFGNVDEMLGYEQGAFPRTVQAWMDALHPSDRERVIDAYNRSCRSSERFEQEYLVRHTGGAFLCWRDRGQAIFSSDGRLTKIIGACTDITEREKLEKQLRQSQKMEAIGTLAGGI